MAATAFAPPWPSNRQFSNLAIGLFTVLLGQTDHGEAQSVLSILFDSLVPQGGTTEAYYAISSTFRRSQLLARMDFGLEELVKTYASGFKKSRLSIAIGLSSSSSAKIFFRRWFSWRRDFIYDS